LGFILSQNALNPAWRPIASYVQTEAPSKYFKTS
jgi:hypothetical protein